MRLEGKLRRIFCRSFSIAARGFDTEKIPNAPDGGKRFAAEPEENMEQKKSGRKKRPAGEAVFAAECTVFGLLTAFFALCCLRLIVLPGRTVSVLYLLYAALVFVYQVLLNTVGKRADGACHGRMFAFCRQEAGAIAAEEIVAKKIAAEEVRRQRKGAWKVAALYGGYVLVLAVCRLAGVTTPELFLLGASVMFGLNSVFIHRFCLLRALFMPNVRCCAACGIAGWDYLIFGSALLFAPRLPALTVPGYVVNGFLFLCCLIYTAVWEYNIRKHPARFVPAYNEALSCGRCAKRCVRPKDKKRAL